MVPGYETPHWATHWDDTKVVLPRAGTGIPLEQARGAPRRRIWFVVAALASALVLLAGAVALVVRGGDGCKPGPDAELAACDLAGRDLSDTDLSGADLTGANLTTANLSGALLADADLAGADLTSANLSGALLAGADLVGADLTAANLGSAILEGADLEDAVLVGANLEGADLLEASLEEADLSDANLTATILISARMRGARLTGAVVDGALLSDAELAGATLSGLDLTTADLVGADLSESRLDGASLAGLQLFDTVLAGADLSGADLTGMTAFAANFEGATLDGTVLDATDLSGATGITDEMLLAAFGVPADQLAAQATLRGVRLDSPDTIVAAVAAARDGVAVAGVPAYSGSEAFHPTVILGPDAEPTRANWAFGVQDAWAPMGLRFAELVVVERPVVWQSIEVCEYWSGGVPAPPITRFVGSVTVQVIAAADGHVVAEQAFVGTEPRACEPNEPYWLEELSGELPDLATLAIPWIASYVHPPA